MSTTLVIVLVLAAVAILLIWRRSKKGIFRSKDQLFHSLHQLLHEMDNGFLVFTHSKTDKFLQLRKYRKGDKKGLELDFPVVEWSREYEKSFTDYCSRMGVKFEDQFGSDGARFFNVDFEEDLNSAESFVLGVFQQVIEVSVEDGFYVFVDGQVS